MKSNKCVQVFVGVLLCAMVGAALAESVAIAYSRSADNVWGWARRGTQKEANKVALDLCNQDVQKRDCFLHSIKAMAKATSDGRVGYGWSNESAADAKKNAVANCGHPDCKVVEVISEPGFVTLARSEDDAEGNAVFHLAYAFDNSDNADKTAVNNCKERSGRACRIMLSSSIAGTLSGGAVAAAKPAAPAVSNQNCRPTTPTV